MKTNKWFWMLVCLLTLSAVWVTWGTTKKLYTYYTLNARVPVKTISWKISALNDERYQLQGSYNFFIDTREYLGTAQLHSLIYRNPWAAEKGLRELEKERFNVWYSSKNPTINSLERDFPLKDCIYSVVILGLITYFGALGVYTYRSQNIER
ncbi:MAG: hypothetical protein WC222_06345 [Parachlamydiales bacterium]